MYANLAMELDVAKYIIEKSSKSPCHKRDMVEQLHYRISSIREAKACRILKMSRSVLHYKSIKDDNFFYYGFGIISRKNIPVRVFGKSYGRLRNKGVVVNQKTL